MVASRESYAVFGQVSHLLEALQVCGGDEGTPFPHSLIDMDDGRWALRRRWIKNSEHLEHLAGQHGWSLEVVEVKPAGDEVPFRSCLQDAWLWTYRDPYRPGEERVEPSQYQYLLGARDPLHAQQILYTLTNLTTPDIRAIPLVLDSVAESSPYIYFWAVTMDRLELTALRAAERAWYGPLGYGSVQIFAQWPYRLRIPPEILHRFDWGPGARLVLLSPEPPEVLALRRPEREPVFAELIRVAKLQVPRCDDLELLALDAGKSEIQLSVNIRLVEGDPRNVHEERMAMLREQIHAMQALLDWMRRRTRQPLPEPAVLEPLFIYSAPPGSIPLELRRLLLEWSDQAVDLRALRYQKLAPSPLLSDLYREGEDIHVLTTAPAVATPGSRLGDIPPDLGLRLREYEPSSPYSSFDLMPDWDRFHLKLFAPHHWRPALYPALNPSDVAAPKLAEALQMQPNSSAVLLVQPPGAPLRALKLSLSDFRPLLDEFQWKCTLDFSVDAQATAKKVADDVYEDAMRNLKEKVDERVEAEAGQRIQTIEADLLSGMESLAREMQVRQDAVEAMRDAAAEHQKLVDELSEIMRRIAANGEMFLRDADGLAEYADLVGATLEQVQTVRERIPELQAAADAYTRNIDRLHEIADSAADVGRTRD